MRGKTTQTMTQVNIQVTGTEDDVLNFVALCTKINIIGQRDTERTISLRVKGDSGHPLSFQSVNTLVGNVQVDLVEHCSKRIGEVFNRIIDKTSYITNIDHTI